MPAERHHRQQDQPAGNPGYEARLNEVLGSMASGEFKLLQEAARDQGVSSFYVPIFVYAFLYISKSTL